MATKSISVKNCSIWQKRLYQKNGYIINLMYYRQIKGDYTLVSLTDNSLNQKNLLKYSIYKTMIRITHNARDNHYRISGKMDSCIEK